MKAKRIKNQEEEEFVPKAFRRERENEKDTIPKGKTSRFKKNKKVKKPLNKRVKLIIFFIILILIIISGISLAVSAHSWRKIAKEMLVNENSVIVDSNDNKLAVLGSERKQIKVEGSEIPDNLKNAYVSIEDERFYDHSGVDIKRTGSAIVNYIFHFGSSSYGGSTITQQLVKNMTGDNTDSIIRKVKEWWKAWNLECISNKDEILETYLNIIYVGNGVYGVGAGSKYYFNKDCEDLSLAECAFLAGINNSPNSYNPFGEKDNTEKIEKRTKTVLSKMLELEYINQDEYDEAIKNVEDGLKFKKGTIKTSDAVYSYHTDALINEITRDISDKYNISSDFATNYINMAGLEIVSTQDKKIQNQIETEMEKSKYSKPSKKGGDSSQAAMVVIDHTTGQVLRMCWRTWRKNRITFFK